MSGLEGLGTGAALFCSFRVWLWVLATCSGHLLLNGAMIQGPNLRSGSTDYGPEGSYVCFSLKSPWQTIEQLL